MYGKAVSEVKRVATLMKKFSEYCGGDYTGLFEYADENTNINLGTHAIDFREFVELETGYYITDSDWINTGIFTWEKLVEHLNKEMKKEEGILASFKVPEDTIKKCILEESLAALSAQILEVTDDKFVESFCKVDVQLKPYNPVKNISIEKYYRCAKGAPSQCDQFHSENGILFMSESDCGKYYYWEDYNSKNELIFFRGEKSWVEDNYRKAGLCEQVIPVVKDGVTGERRVVDLGEFTLTGESVLDSSSVSDQPYRDFSNMVNSLDDTKRITLKGTLEEKKAALLKELSSKEDLVETSDVEEFERKLSAYVVANNLNIGFPEITWESPTPENRLKAKTELDPLKVSAFKERLSASVEKKSPSSIKSDGGKSDYYKIELPQWLLDKHSEKGFIMLEDLAEIMFENDFNFTNVFKAQKRMFELTKGQGKAGNDFGYDATKCKYYTDKQVEVFNRNKK